MRFLSEVIRYGIKYSIGRETHNVLFAEPCLIKMINFVGNAVIGSILTDNYIWLSTMTDLRNLMMQEEIRRKIKGDNKNATLRKMQK